MWPFKKRRNMDKQELLKKRKEVEDQQKIAEINFHRLAGVLAFIDNEIKLLDKEETK